MRTQASSEGAGTRTRHGSRAEPVESTGTTGIGWWTDCARCPIRWCWPTPCSNWINTVGIKCRAMTKTTPYFLARAATAEHFADGLYLRSGSLWPVRDMLLRRRLMLVHQRSALMISFKSLYTRTTGQAMNLGKLKGMEPSQAAALYEHPANQLIATVQKEHIDQLGRSIARIEKAVLKSARELPYYDRLNTLPGVGKILGMTINSDGSGRDRTVRAKAPATLPVIGRAVDSPTQQQREEQGQNNRKCGNKYTWVGLCGSGQFRQTLR